MLLLTYRTPTDTELLLAEEGEERGESVDIEKRKHKRLGLGVEEGGSSVRSGDQVKR